jgi:hypothetical protein
MEDLKYHGFVMTQKHKEKVEESAAPKRAKALLARRRLFGTNQ